MKPILTSLKLGKTEQRVVFNALECKPIKKFQKPDSDKLNNTLKMICKYSCGIITELDLPALSYISRMINRNFSDLSEADISDAFERHAAGKWNDILHYGQFSVEFIGKVLERYYQERKDILWKVRMAQEAEIEKNKPKVVIGLDEQEFNTLINFVEVMFKIPYNWGWDRVVKHLEIKCDKGQEKELIVKYLKERYKGIEVEKYNSKNAQGIGSKYKSYIEQAFRNIHKEGSKKQD